LTATSYEVAFDDLGKPTLDGLLVQPVGQTRTNKDIP